MMAWPNIWAQRMNPVSFPQMGIANHPMLSAQSMMRPAIFGGQPITAGVFNQGGPVQQPMPAAYANPFLRRMM